MIKQQQIRHALALLEHGNFRKAAHSQYISQPAFSRSIAKLEATLGVKLFHRHPSGVTATVYGQILRKYGSQIVSSAQELEREIRLTRGLGVGEMSIAMGPYPAEISGHRAIGELVGRHPNLRCKIAVADWHEVENMVMNRSVDIGLAELSAAEQSEHLKVEPIGNHRVAIFCRSGHPVLKKRRIRKRDLDSYPVVLIRLPIRLVAFPGRFISENNSTIRIPSIEVQDVSLSTQIVMQSDAISAGTPYQIENELSSGLLSVVPYSAPRMCLNYGFIHLKDRPLSPVALEYM